MCAAYYFAFGEFPLKSWVWVVITAGYVWFELIKQRFVGFDTIEDIVFVVGYGASASLSGFSEVVTGDPYVALNMTSLLPFFFVSACHLISGSVYRMSLRGHDS